MQHRKYIKFSALLLSAILIIVTTLNLSILSKLKLEEFQDYTTGAVLNYPPTALSQKITEQDKKDKIIFRARQIEGQEKAFLITLRYENGLRPLAQLAKMEPINLIINGVEKAYPQRFPNFKLLEMKKFSRDGRPGAEINFKYKGPSGENIRQRLLILMASDDRAVYLAGQTKQADFEDLREDFDQIFDSLRFD